MRELVVVGKGCIEPAQREARPRACQAGGNGGGRELEMTIESGNGEVGPPSSEQRQPARQIDPFEIRIELACATKVRQRQDPASFSTMHLTALEVEPCVARFRGEAVVELEIQLDQAGGEVGMRVKRSDD